MTFYTLARSDVGQPFLRVFGRVWRVSEFMGRILPNDVGKRVYLTESCTLRLEDVNDK